MGKSQNNGGAEIVNKAAGGALAKIDYAQDAGAGFDRQTNADIAIPFLKIMQSNSPEVTGENGKGVEGAKIGMLMNSVTRELFDGQKGIVAQPCDTKHVFVEWKPRNQGGGFVAEYPIDSEVVKKAVGESKEFGVYKTPAGNDLEETWYVPILQYATGAPGEEGNPMLLAFTSTKIKVYKGINTRLRSFQVPAPNADDASRRVNPAMFTHRLLIQTFGDKNNHGAFQNLKISPLNNGDVKESMVQDQAQIDRGREFQAAFRGGLARVNYEAGREGGGGNRGGGPGAPANPGQEEPPF